MASSFNTTVTDLENELMTLILDGQIQARIDSHNKVLFSQDVDQRNVTFERSLEMASAYQVWSLSSLEVSRQLLTDDLNQVSSVSLLMTSSTSLTNGGLFKLTRRPLLTQAV